MEEFIRALGLVGPVMGWLSVKKNSELPWVSRLLRWAIGVGPSAYVLAYVVNSYLDWFWR